MNTTTTTTTTTTLKKWEAGQGLGPRMLKQFNDAINKASFNARGVCTLTGIIGKPETESGRDCVMVSLFGGSTNPAYEPKLAEIQAKHGNIVTAANYKGLVDDLLALASWLHHNPIIKDERITQEAHDAKEANYAQAMAERKRKDEEHDAAKAIIAGELRAKYPWAVGRRSGENLKTLLGQTFPGIVFSVRSDSNSLTVSWENGPADGEVSKIGDQFRAGRFDGMTDGYDYDNSARTRAWSEVMGTVRYVSYNRAVDRQPVIDGLKASITDWDADGHHSVSQVAYRLIGKSSFPAGAVLTGVERLPGDGCGQMEDWFKITYTTPEPSHSAPAPTPVTNSAGITVSRNIEKGGVEIRFPSKPEASMIERVKSQGFRWSRFSGCWWAKATDGKVAFAYSLAGQEQPKNEQSEQVRDPGEDAADRHSEAMGAEEVTERLMEMDAFTR